MRGDIGRHRWSDSMDTYLLIVGVSSRYAMTKHCRAFASVILLTVACGGRSELGGANLGSSAGGSTAVGGSEEMGGRVPMSGGKVAPKWAPQPGLE